MLVFAGEHEQSTIMSPGKSSFCAVLLCVNKRDSCDMFLLFFRDYSTVYSLFFHIYFCFPIIFVSLLVRLSFLLPDKYMTNTLPETNQLAPENRGFPPGSLEIPIF